jgi:hypothetical protein
MLLWMKTRLPVLLTLGAFLVLAAVVARGSSSVPVGTGKPLFAWLKLPSITLSSDPGVATNSGAPLTGSWATIAGWAIVALPLVLLLAAIAAALIIAMRMRKIGPPTPVVKATDAVLASTEASASQLLRAATQARATLNQHRGGPPSDAVIAAWVRLEEVAEGNGNHRFAYQTSSEFSGVLAERYQGVGQGLDELRGLYQRARFGAPGTVGASEAAAAHAALDGIVAVLTGPSHR